MKENSPKHVVILFPTTRISRVDKMRGVFKFIAETKAWTIDILQGEPSAATMREADGFLATGLLPEKTMRRLRQTDKPTVFIELENPRTVNVSHVFSDTDAFARQVAGYFLKQGLYKGFVMLLPPDARPFHQSCLRSLRPIFTKAHVPFSPVAAAGEIDFSQTPLAVYAPNDELAAETIHRCQALGLNVPRDVSVLGFSNDVIFCENHRPSISSVDPDFERQGYLAARELARLMSARPPAKGRRLPVGILQIAERESTHLPQTGEALVRKALTFIRENARSSIGVMDVVRHLRVSRRLAELRFHERYDSSIRTAVLRFRLEATRAELRRSGDSIAKVCERCGWKSENGPKKLFRKFYKMSMRDYRARPSASDL